MADFEFVLTHIPATTMDSGGHVRLHCTGHKPPLVLGKWPASLVQDEEDAYRAAVTAAINAHRPQHDAPSGKLEP